MLGSRFGGMGFGILLMLAATFAEASCVKESDNKPMSKVVVDDQFKVGGKSAHDIFSERAAAELAIAACKGDGKSVLTLVAGGANPNAVGFQGISPLLWAERCRSLAGMEALLRAGADPNYHAPGNVAGESGFSAVFVAAGIEEPKFLKLLLRFKGDPNDVEEDSGQTALIRAFNAGMVNDVWSNYYALLEAGANIEREYPEHGHTIAEYAASVFAFVKVEELLERGYSRRLDVIGKYAGSVHVPLGEANEKARLRVMELLRRRGVEVVDNSGPR